MTFSAKQFLVLGSGIALAFGVGAGSFAIANSTRAPASALMIKVPPQGFAQASMARALFAARLSRDQAAKPSTSERRLAASGFAAEPLATAAFPVIIRSLAADGDTRRSAQLLQLASRLTRRDNLLNALLIENEIKRNRPVELIRLFGRAMAVDTQVRSFYMERMASATASPGAVAGLAPMLGESPDWEQAYWDAVLMRADLLPQAGKLRQRLAGPPWNRRAPSDADRNIVTRLAIGRNPRLAYDLAHSLAMRAPTGGSLLLNGSFDQKPQFVPFDWELIQNGEVGSAIDKKRGVLSLNGLPATNSIVARQLVELPGAGKYRLEWKMSGLSQSPGALLRLRLSCAEANGYGVSAAAVNIVEGASSHDFVVPASKCRWHWAAIELDAAQSEVGVDANFEQIVLRRGANRSDVAGRTGP